MEGAQGGGVRSGLTVRGATGIIFYLTSTAAGQAPGAAVGPIPPYASRLTPVPAADDKNQTTSPMAWPTEVRLRPLIEWGLAVVVTMLLSRFRIGRPIPTHPGRRGDAAVRYGV